MCTLIIMRQMFADFPLVVASNRDEDPSRPSADPMVWSDRTKIFAPRDLVRGGTWIGVARHGLFAGITNRDSVLHRRHCASRGLLVADALEQPTAQAARNLVVRTFASAPYNGFQLAVADAREAFLIIGDGDRLICEELPIGATILTAFGAGPTHAPRAVEIARRIAAVCEGGDPSAETLNGLLTFHADGDPLAAACVHDDTRESHVTVSSMTVHADRNWSAFTCRFRRGPACLGPFGPSTRIAIKHERQGT